jgi:hypothetical protein
MSSYKETSSRGVNLPDIVHGTQDISQLASKDKVSLPKVLCYQLFCSASTSASETCPIDLPSVNKLKLLSRWQIVCRVCGVEQLENC